MIRRDPVSFAASARRALIAPALLGLFLGLAGCSAPQVRSQKGEESDKERYGITTVGDIATFSNAEPVVCTGVGLVEGLEGTGSPAPAGDLRQIVEHELRREKVKDVKEILASKDFSIVLVHAVIPPGARKGDKLDLEISLPPGSRTTSLLGGYLRRCTLYNHEYASTVNPAAAGSNAAFRGSPLARAEGAILVGTSGGDEKEKMRKGRIWGGGICLADRQFHVLLNPRNQFAAVAGNLATRVNTAFQGTVVMTPGNEIAVAHNNTLVTLNVPAQYKLNLPRFLRVVRMVPLEDAPPPADKKPRPPYRERLGEDLLDPARTLLAALRLEALGTSSVQALKEGLKHPHPLVRFCSAEALAYLGSPSAGEDLARLVEQQPYLRAFALTAMASLDEAVCHVKLQELMSADTDDETRYGSFRALRTLDEKAPEVRGELLNDTYWLHEIAPGSKPLVHLSSTRRAEVVLFGKAPKLVPPFSLLAGEFALTASAENQQCMITHVPLHGGDGGPSRTNCPFELGEVIRTLAKMGASYPEVIEMIVQADACKNLSCRVRIDALPQAVPLEEVAAAGREQLGHESASKVQLIKPDANFGATPTLFEKDDTRRPFPSSRAGAN